MRASPLQIAVIIGMAACIALLACIVRMHDGPASVTDSSIIQKLVEQSARGKYLFETYEDEPSVPLGAGDAHYAVEYITAHRDRSSYLVLFALRRDYPDVYGGMDGAARAEILCSALRQAKVMNDWGCWARDRGYDALATEALLETGLAALPYLRPLLNDVSPAMMLGSIEATASWKYKHRKADYAQRCI